MSRLTPERLGIYLDCLARQDCDNCPSRIEGEERDCDEPDPVGMVDDIAAHIAAQEAEIERLREQLRLTHIDWLAALDQKERGDE